MSTDRLSATVVGGGIAGLASAISLAQAGWRVTVLERAPAFGEVGAGLAVTGNGLTALAALGLDAAVRAAGYQTCAAGYQDPRGRWLMRLRDTSSDPSAVTTMLGLHRQRLHAALARAAGAADGVELVPGAEVVAVRPAVDDGDLADVIWRTQRGEYTAGVDLVVGADGVRSVVRRHVFPAVGPMYSGSTSWRAVISDTDTDGRLTQAWGPGTEFGSLRVSDTEIYWWGYFRHSEGAKFADELAAARDHFAGWAPWIRAMIASTSADQLMRHDVYYLPHGLPRYVGGRVVLVGDAAHATLPTAGQGAASALEDGVCVGRMIGAPVRAGRDLADALADFDRARRPRCQQMNRTANMIARMGCDLGGGWRQTVRNTLLRITPPGPLMRAGESIVRWQAPAARPAPDQR